MSLYTAGDEPVTAPGIHDEPSDNSAQVALDQLVRRIQAAGAALPKHILAQVLYAVAGISIGGIEPFAGLAAWADDLEQQALDAYNGALTAQNSANYANSQATGLLVTDASGGVSLFSAFDGPSATNIGGSFTQVYSGSGGGTWGIDGSGNTKWTKAGGLSLACYARYNTPLNTDNQRVRMVLTQLPAPIGVGGYPLNYLCGRMNSACDSFVFVRFSVAAIGLGYCSGGSISIFTSMAFTPSVGDVYDLYLGTENDEREFIVKRNGNELVPLTYTDSADDSDMGSSNLYAGLGCLTTGNIADQQIPGVVTAWAAIDRQDTTH